MTVGGIDYSTKAIDVVLIDEDTGRVSRQETFPLALFAGDAFDRTRRVRAVMPKRSWWEEHGVVAVGIEDPRGIAYSAGVLYRVQGAILACLPTGLLVQPWDPMTWRVRNGMSGRAPKDDVRLRALELLTDQVPIGWPQDAFDAYCIARATRDAFERTPP